MIKSKEERNNQQHSCDSRKKQSSWTTIIDHIPNNISPPTTIELTPSSSVSSLTINTYSKKKQNNNKVDNFLKQMKTRTKLNITSNKQFPPLQQQVTKDIHNNSQDEASGDDESLPDLAHKKNRTTTQKKKIH